MMVATQPVQQVLCSCLPGPESVRTLNSKTSRTRSRVFTTQPPCVVAGAWKALTPEVSGSTTLSKRERSPSLLSAPHSEAFLLSPGQLLSPQTLSLGLFSGLQGRVCSTPSPGSLREPPRVGDNTPVRAETEAWSVFSGLNRRGCSGSDGSLPQRRLAGRA